MSIKRTAYKGLSFPEDDTYLTVRPAFTRMCMDNKSASKLLSALIFKWDPGADVELEKVNTFSIQLTQAELIKAMCDEATSKTIHDSAMPCLHLFGYADVDESTYPFTYTVHMDRVRVGLDSCKQGTKQLEKVLIVWAKEKGLDKPDGKTLNKKNFHIALEKVLIVIRESSNSIGDTSNSCGKSSNSHRGRKPRTQAVSTTQIEDPKNNKNSKHIEEQERERESTHTEPTQPPTFDVTIGTSAPSQDNLSSEQEALELSPHSERDVTFNVTCAGKGELPQASVRIADDIAPEQPNKRDEGKTVEQAPLITVPLSEPDMSGKWSNKVCVRYAEWKNKKLYDDKMRDTQENAASWLRHEYKGATMEQFKDVYDDWFKWWKENRGSDPFHVSDLKVKKKNGVVRFKDSLDRIEARKNNPVASNIRQFPNTPRRANEPTPEEYAVVSETEKRQLENFHKPGGGAERLAQYKAEKDAKLAMEA